METIRNFFKKSIVQWGLTLAAIGGVIAYFFKANDFSRPPIPDPNIPRDYSKDLEKLDPSKPIGVFIFNVDHSKRKDWMKYTTPGVNASRNNYAEKMREYYGDNMVFIDNPGPGHLTQFSKDFNAKFGAQKPEVHFAANHHQGTYDDTKFAEFLASFETKNKRALILSCGPVSKAYEKSGCEYVMIPAPDGLGLGPELSLEISPAYREAIGWLATVSDPEEAKKKFAERSFYNVTQEWSHKLSGFIEEKTTGKGGYNPPIVVTPPVGLPKQPTSVPNIPGR
jgi:hypothetical protein